MPRLITTALSLALAAATFASAQQPQKPCPAATPAQKQEPDTQPPCTQPAAPTPVDPFAFPEEQSRKAADAAATPTPQPLPDAPTDTPKPAPPAVSSSSRDPNDPTATTNPQDPQEEPPPINDVGSSGQKTGRQQKKQVDRVTEDLDVAEFYRKKGNLRAAYLRYKDAVDHGPTQPDAHLGLAQVAAQLGHRDEAIDHYKTYLTLDPPEDNIPPAKKALADLEATAPETKSPTKP